MILLMRVHVIVGFELGDRNLMIRPEHQICEDRQIC